MSSRVWWEAATNIRHALSERSFVSCGGALSTGWIHHLWLQGTVPPGFNPLRGMPTGSEAFLELPIALGFGLATGPTLKTALCHIRTLVGRRINTARSLWRRFVSCGGALSIGCGCVPHSPFGCVPPLDTSPLASGGRPPRL